MLEEMYFYKRLCKLDIGDRRVMLQPNGKQFLINLFVLLSLVFFAQCLNAQDISPERGVNTNKSYSVSDIETISMQSGNLMLNVPLGSLPAGRGGMSAGVGLNYNSKLWDNVTALLDNKYQDYLVKSDDGGWRYNYKYYLSFENRRGAECQTGNPVDNHIYKTGLVLPDGSRHTLYMQGYSNFGGYNEFLPDGASGCLTLSGSGPLVYYTLDGTYLRLELERDGDTNYINNAWTLYMPDGSRVVHYGATTPPAADVVQRAYDRNGNFIDVLEKASDSSYSNHKTTYIKDQLDRKVVIEYEASTNQDKIYSKGVNGADVISRVTWRDIVVHKTFNGCNLYPPETGCGSISLNSTQHVVDRVYLPEQFADPGANDDYFYEFDYNANATTNPSSGWGEVNSVRAPSGALSEYDYGLDGVNNVTTNVVILDRPLEKRLIYNLEYDGSSPQTTDTWEYATTYYTLDSGGSAPPYATASVTMTAPNGGVSSEYYTEEGELYKSVRPDGSIVEKVYQLNEPYSDYFVTGARANVFPKYEFVSITDSGGTPTKTAIKEYTQDKNGNTTSVKEYDFVAYSSVPRTDGKPTGLPSGASSYLKRISTTEVYNPTPDSASTTYTDADSYHLASSPRLIHLPKAAEVQDASSTPKSRSEITYDHTDYSASNTLGGNPTHTYAWDSTRASYSNPLTSSNWITTSATHNSYGMPLTATDANGNVTQITYGNVTVGGSSVTGPYPTQTVTAYGTAIARTSTAVYDFHTGLVTTATDYDNSLSTVIVYDDLGRQKIVKSAYGTSLESWTQTDYHDADRFVVAKSDIETVQDGKKVAAQYYDQLGRVRLSRTLEDASTQVPDDPCLTTSTSCLGIKVQTRYATTYSSPNGYNYQLHSNPYRASTSSGASGEETMGWTRSKAIQTGHHAEVETLSGSSLPAPWGSNTSTTGMVQTDTDANATTVTDQAGKLRRSITNGIGQMTRVDEPNSSNVLGSVGSPNQNTDYAYDVLNNLLTVTQGSQTRTFAYSSLSRLTSAANPESGTITYAYDNNGNLTSKVDARTITTMYAYDYLNRVTQRSYNDSPQTPTVNYTYDAQTHAKGKLTKVASSVSTTEYTSFDILGRVTGHKQITDGGDTNGYTTGYTYKLNGALDEETYPSTRVVKNVLDADGDLSVVESKKNSSSGYWSYANSLTYNAAGAVTSMQLGNGRWESTIFNSRLQPTQIALGTIQSGYDKLKLNFDYGTTANNGNVQSQTITVPTVGNTNGFVAVQSYTYDSLNRLNDATEMVTPNGGSASQSWKQTFVFDRYGNRRFDFTGGNTTVPASTCAEAICNPTISTSTNRLTSSGYSFDSSGNTTYDAALRKFTYDAENKQTKVESTNSSQVVTGTVGEYSYDGDGKRVKKVAGDETTIFVYDAGGKEIAEYSTIVANSTDAKVNYLTDDHLGSPRINTDANGNVISRHDYHPFGEEIDGTGGRTTGLNYGDDAVRKQFTGYERDNESLLDFAQARYFAPALGRFSSPDDFSNDTDIFDPASWNLYAYVRNNPIKNTDPSGKHIYIEFEDSDGSSQTVQYYRGKLYTTSKDKNGNLIRGKEYAGDNQYANDAKNYLNDLRTDQESELGQRIADLESNKLTNTIKKDSNDPGRDEAVATDSDALRKGIPTGTTVYWSDKPHPISAWDYAPGYVVPAYAALAHELLGHSWDTNRGIDNPTDFFPVRPENGHPAFIPFGIREPEAVEIENQARRYVGDETRKWYGKYEIPKPLPPSLKPSPGRPRSRGVR